MCVVFITRIFFKEYHIYIYIHDNMKKVQKVVFGKRFKIYVYKNMDSIKKEKNKNKKQLKQHTKKKNLKIII